MPKTIVVPLDGSRTAERAVPVARTLAAHLDACSIVTVTVPLHSHDDTARRYSEAVGAWQGGPDLRAELVAGDDPAEAIARAAAAEPDPVICMTTRGGGRIATSILGSVATGVLRRATSPVLMVGPEVGAAWWHEPARVLACWAGPGSAAVLPVARDLARDLGGELWLTSVFHPLDLQVAAAPDAAFAEAEAVLGHGGDHRHHVLRSTYPAGAIADAARSVPATLVAMTTRARRGISRAVLGSVTMEVVHRSPCPVLVVRTGPEEGAPA